MFVNKFEDMFEGFELFKRPLATYNNEFLNKYVLHMLFSLKLHYMMQNMVPSTHLFFKKKIYNYSTQ